MVKQQSFGTQLHNNAVAIISLVVAIIALVLNTWRLEQTEKNRNVRQAGFEMLKGLGELQSIVNSNLYQINANKIDPIQGWTYIATMSDMAVLMPHPVPENLNALIKVWGNQWKNISQDENSADQISHQIDLMRDAVMKSLNQLH